MALDKKGLKTAIKNILIDMAGRESDPAQAREDFAEQLSTAIDTFVKSGDGKYQAGTLVAGSTAVTSVGGATTVKIQ